MARRIQPSEFVRGTGQNTDMERAIAVSCQQGWIVQADGQYCLLD